MGTGIQIEFIKRHLVPALRARHLWTQRSGSDLDHQLQPLGRAIDERAIPMSTNTWMELQAWVRWHC